MRIMVVSAIGRESSTCYILAQRIANICTGHGAEVDFATPTQVGLPVNDGNVAWDLPEVTEWRSRIERTHAHLWVSPEYHSAMTGGFKNLFDYLDKAPLEGDVVGLFALAGGAMAALNTLNGMSVMARSLGAWVAPDYCALTSNDVKNGPDERPDARVARLCETV
ncbi:MAG TPA: NADPH-dependent FMN reductase, partial [Acidimicrobiales bacterium]|nr:NADPH-dependent FMN reductase [Acidimicrobiales bacterium]